MLRTVKRCRLSLQGDGYDLRREDRQQAPGAATQGTRRRPGSLPALRTPSSTLGGDTGTRAEASPVSLPHRLTLPFGSPAPRTRPQVVDYIRSERMILDRLDHPGIAKLHFTFQDADSLYMGLEHCEGGELYEQLQARGALPLADARFYAAEVVDVLCYLQQGERMWCAWRGTHGSLCGHPPASVVAEATETVFAVWRGLDAFRRPALSPVPFCAGWALGFSPGGRPRARCSRRTPPSAAAGGPEGG